MGMCCLAATILKRKIVSIEVVMVVRVRSNLLCRYCVSPGVEGCRVGVKSISKTSSH
jgi:hypothetical protein